MIEEHLTNSEPETLRLAESIGKKAAAGDVYALTGELGTGKTVIAKGIALGIGIKEEVTSPTFLLLEIYDNDPPLYHFDLYRIESAGEFDTLNFDEYWYGSGVSVIEWAERAYGHLPDTCVKINIQWIDETRRRITIEYPGN